MFNFRKSFDLADQMSNLCLKLPTLRCCPAGGSGAGVPAMSTLGAVTAVSPPCFRARPSAHPPLAAVLFYLWDTRHLEEIFTYGALESKMASK